MFVEELISIYSKCERLFSLRKYKKVIVKNSLLINPNLNLIPEQQQQLRDSIFHIISLLIESMGVRLTWLNCKGGFLYNIFSQKCLRGHIIQAFTVDLFEGFKADLTPLVSKPPPASVKESVRKGNTFLNGTSLEGELKSQSLGAFFSQMWPILLRRMLRKIAP